MTDYKIKFPTTVAEAARFVCWLALTAIDGVLTVAFGVIVWGLEQALALLDWIRDSLEVK